MLEKGTKGLTDGGIGASDEGTKGTEDVILLEVLVVHALRLDQGSPKVELGHHIYQEILLRTGYHQYLGHSVASWSTASPMIWNYCIMGSRSEKSFRCRIKKLIYIFCFLQLLMFQFSLKQQKSGEA